jgi:hypothetical protein
MLVAVNSYLVYSTRRHYGIDGPPHRDKYVYDQHGLPPIGQGQEQGQSPYQPHQISTSQQQSGRSVPRVPNRTSSKPAN